MSPPLAFSIRYAPDCSLLRMVVTLRVSTQVSADLRRLLNAIRIRIR